MRTQGEITKALKDVPDLPVPTNLLSALKADIQIPGKGGLHRQSLWRILMHRRTIPYTAVAAAAILLLGLGSFLGLWDVTSVAFADLAQPLLSARSASFQVALYSGDHPPQNSHMVCTRDGLIRQTKDSSVSHIVNTKTGQVLTLDKEEQSATMEVLKQRGAVPTVDLLGHLQRSIQRALTQEDRFVKTLGHRIIQNREAKGYQLPLLKVEPSVIGWQDKGSFTVWVDLETQAPLQLEWFHEGFDLKTVATQIQLDMDVNPDLFSMAVPQGYRFVQKTEEDTKDAEKRVPETVDEKALIERLRAWTKRSQGLFPSSAGIEALKDLDPNATYHFEQKGWQGFEGKVQVNAGSLPDFWQMLSLIGGGGPLGMLPTEVEWQYTGKGIQLGDKAAIVFWYKLPETGEYRALFGDLTVRTVTVDQLP